MADSFADWCNVYRRITNWEIELSDSTDQSIKEVIEYQKHEANQEFCKFVRRNYYDWINKRDETTPVMSHTLMRSKIFPVADENPKTTLLLIDNFRYDQWRSISPCCAATTTSRPTISTARSCPRRPNTPAMPFSPA